MSPSVGAILPTVDFNNPNIAESSFTFGGLNISCIVNISLIVDDDGLILIQCLPEYDLV